MPNIVDAVIVVDTIGLDREFPNGIPQHHSGNPQDIGQFFKVLTDIKHIDSETPDKSHLGIKCQVNDSIYFRAVSKADTAHGAIIIEFADRNQGTTPVTITDYLSIPTFRTSRWDGFSYDNNSVSQPYSVWDNWKMWNSVLKDDNKIQDPHMSVQALQSTGELPTGRIQYTLGLRVNYPGYVRDYWFDPTILVA